MSCNKSNEFAAASAHVEREVGRAGEHHRIDGQAHHRYVLETVRHPIVGVEACVTLFDNNAGGTLEKPRLSKLRTFHPAKRNALFAIATRP